MIRLPFFWSIFNPLKPKIENPLKTLGVLGRSNQKKFFLQKVITFLGRKFFSKTNVLGFRSFSKKGPKILKNLRNEAVWTTFFGEFQFSQPLDIQVEKKHGKQDPGGCSTPPVLAPLRESRISRWKMYILSKFRYRA